MREIKFRAWDIDGRKMFNVMNNYADNSIQQDIFGNTEIIIMQYTGLKDTNGVEIYESDIGEYGKTNGIPFYAKVVYHNELARYMFEFDEGHGINYSELCDYDGSMPADWFEVIGNIYENQDLLS